jgi:hypothetical protein
MYNIDNTVFSLDHISPFNTPIYTDKTLLLGHKVSRSIIENYKHIDIDKRDENFKDLLKRENNDIFKLCMILYSKYKQIPELHSLLKNTIPKKLISKNRSFSYILTKLRDYNFNDVKGLYFSKIQIPYYTINTSKSGGSSNPRQYHREIRERLIDTALDDYKQDKALADYDERYNIDEQLYVEIVSGDRLKERILQKDAKYMGARYIINSQFNSTQRFTDYDVNGSNNIWWFLLSKGDLIVSLCGYFKQYNTENSYNIYTVATRKGYTGKGYMSLLMRYITESIIDVFGCNSPKYIMLDVIVGKETTEKLIKFYSRLGWTIIENRERSTYMRYECKRKYPELQLPEKNGDFIPVSNIKH